MIQVMSRVKQLTLAMVLVVLLLLISLIKSVTISPQKVSAATPGDVIINEIMYNPSTGNQNDEFLELYNTTGSDINLDGWSFTQGITLTFSGGVTIPTHGYIIISPNSGSTLVTYGKTTSATYLGNLSNGGEVVTLVDASAAVINSVNYDDVAPWPLTPDGSGPSLELRATNLDNSLPESWGASLSNGGTPLDQNSVTSVALASIANVTDPNDVAAGAQVDIQATVTGTGVSSVVMKYKINFGSVVTVAMSDDGAHNDGAAGDNIYGASIPAQAVKTLVRFRIEAVNGSGTQSVPSADDSMNYEGYYVKEPGSGTGEAPLLEWFIDDADYADMYAQTALGNVFQYPAVIVYGNDVYDNASVRAKGSNTLYDPKKSIKVDLPTGHTLTYPGLGAPVKDFHLNANFNTTEAGRVATFYWAMKQAGLDSPDSQVTELHRNGNFEGSYLLIDKFGSGWRSQYGFSNGDLYEDGGPTIWPDHMKLDRQDPLKRGYVLDENNIPALINYVAMAAILQHHDTNATQNIVYYHSNKTDRWQILPWDHNGDLFNNGPILISNSYDNYETPLGSERYYQTAFYDQPDLRKAYYRRLSTLVDMFYANDSFRNKYLENSNAYTNLNALDYAKWPTQSKTATKEADLASIDRLKMVFTAYLRDSWSIPPMQTLANEQAITIQQAVASADNTNEYIELRNPSSIAIDISGWMVEGINYRIPYGSVIPANSSMYLLRDDVGYKASHDPVLVAGQYGTDLGTTGTLTLKNNTNVTIDTYDY